MDQNIGTLEELYERICEGFLNDACLSSHLDILKKYNGEDWREYVKFDPMHYNRIKIDTCSNDRFEFILICWDVNQGSLIHDHPESGCLLKVLSGSLIEERYQNADQSDPIRIGESILEENLVSYMESNRIIHRIINAGDSSMKTSQTVSLHIYSPPNYECRCY